MGLELRNLRNKRKREKKNVTEYFRSLATHPKYAGLKCTRCNITYQGKRKTANQNVRNTYKHIANCHFIDQISKDMEKYHNVIKGVYTCPTEGCSHIANSIKSLIDHKGGKNHNL